MPLLVLGLAGLVVQVAVRLRSEARERRNLAPQPTVVVGVLVAAAFIPVWGNGVPLAPRRPSRRRAAVLEGRGRRFSAQGNATRILEIPGSDFAAYRWGDLIEPLTPGLTDRPYVARETLPSGSAASVNLLVALDHRLHQDDTFEPDAELASYATRGHRHRWRCALTSSTSASTRRMPRQLWRGAHRPSVPTRL